MRPFLLHSNKTRPCRLSAVPGTETAAAGAPAHTFSCIVEKTLVHLQSCLSNMSKIYRRQHAANVENNGFEPLTPCLQSRCSSQLS